MFSTLKEHFSTPLIFAQQHFFLDAELIPFPTGTGALSGALKSEEQNESIDVAIGLTEGFVADLGRSKTAGVAPGYGLVGTYVESPLCWAISTGAGRDEFHEIGDVKDKRVAVSRVGSGSYVMSFVLADQRGWLHRESAKGPFEVVPIGDFAALRKAVGKDKMADFFMWEHFTTKHFWDNGELKRIGEIYTPWPSWMIAARNSKDAEIEDMAEKINKGIQYYRDQKEEALDHITNAMEYSKDDALEWMKTVSFAQDVRGVTPSVIDNTASLLKKAGVLQESAGGSDHMITARREHKEEVLNPAEV